MMLKRLTPLLLVLVLVGLASSLFLNRRYVYMPDSITYVKGAESIAGGDGYLRDGRPVTERPPGYSIMLAFPLMFGVHDVVVFKMLNILCALLACTLFWLAWRGTFGGWLSAGVVGASALFFPSLYYTHAIQPEMLFTALLGLFLLGATRFLQQGGRGGCALMCVAAMLLPVVRYAGIAVWPICMLVAWMGLDEQRRFWRWPSCSELLRLVSVAVLIMLPFLGILYRNWAQTGAAMAYDTSAMPAYYSLTLRQLGIEHFTWWVRLWVNLRGYLCVFVVPDQAAIAKTSALPGIVWIVCAGIWAAIISGGVLCWRQPAGKVAGLLCVFYGLLLLSNNWYDVRYLVPVMPVLFLYLVRACGVWGASVLRHCRGISGRWPGLARPLTWSYVAVSGLVVMNLAFLTFAPQADRLRAAQYDGIIGNIYSACEYLRTAEPEGKVLVAGSAGFMALWADREFVSLSSYLDADQKSTISEIPDGVRFILLDESKFVPFRQLALEPFVERHTDVLKLVFQQEDTIVYERLPE